MSELYFDNSSTTKVCEQAAAKVLEMMTEHYGNPSSLHTMGFEAEQELTAARTAVAQLLGAKSEEITFTSGGTEANNLAIFGAAHSRQKRGSRIVTTAIEHPSVLRTMEQLEKEGFEVVSLKPDHEGHIAPEQLFGAINTDTILVSMMAVNNEVGTILPIEAAAKAITQAKAPALLHVDAVQAFGKIPLKPSKSKIDLMSVSAHKIHGPKGIGALFMASGVHIVPRTFGGGQEKNLRPGTEAMPLIAGFGAAVKALPNLTEETNTVAEINNYCREEISKIDDMVINSPADALPYILNFSTCSVRSETMLHFLASKEMYVSTGSACSKAKPSHVLSAMELGRERINSSLKISFSRYNTLEEAHRFISALKQGLGEITKRPL